MRLRQALTTAAALGALLILLARAGTFLEDPAPLGPRRGVASGVSLYPITDSALLDPPGPLSAWALQVEPDRADVRPALARDRVMHTETVASIAGRHGAAAAVNAGFFLPNGDPSGIYKLDGQLVSDTRRARGAVGIVRTGPEPRLLFGRVSATMTLRILRDGQSAGEMEITGVDTTRQIGRLMLFTPFYHPHTDTAPGGLEWPVAGEPLRVIGPPQEGGETPIPPTGFVLSYGGRTPPPGLASLAPGIEVELQTTYRSPQGDELWPGAAEIIGGAGLLIQDGRPVEDWQVENLSAGFAEARHPRTMIGTRSDGSIWLVVVDGRQPQLSAGMTLPELRALARRLGLLNALNLDGGGSSTMWVNGEIVNSPSDPAGPRAVGDALLIFSR